MCVCVVFGRVFSEFVLADIFIFSAQCGGAHPHSHSLLPAEPDSARPRMTLSGHKLGEEHVGSGQR